MSGLALVYNPTLDDFGKVRNFADGPFVRDAYYGFIRDNIFLARYDNEIVGWLTYIRNEIYVELSNIYVAPQFRRKGVAAFLAEGALRYFSERGVCAAELVAVSKEGRAHAKAMGFALYDEKWDWNQRKTIYTKILCPYRRQTRAAKNMLCLWKQDIYELEPGTEPDMCWSLSPGAKPIVFRCDSYEWVASVVKNGETIKSGVIKDVIGNYSKWLRIEPNGTDDTPLWYPDCMEGIQYQH